MFGCRVCDWDCCVKCYEKKSEVHGKIESELKGKVLRPFVALYYEGT